jgi:lipopolysaccharide export LptBFGC system permease protein LptF
MFRWRPILGLVAGGVMIVSSAAHGLFGWKAMQAALEETKAPADLILALGLGWRFGSAAMLAFGCIVVATFVQRLSGVAVSPMPGLVIGAAYVVFGVGALTASKFDPFFLVFVVPGVLVLAAALPGRQA